MVDRPGAGEAECASLESIDRDLVHHREFGVGRLRLVVAAAFVSHDIRAQRRMRQLGADVDRPTSAIERVQVVGEGLPVPRQPFRQSRAGDVLDALHQLDEAGAIIVAGTGRSEPNAAVAHDRGRDTVR